MGEEEEEGEEGELEKMTIIIIVIISLILFQTLSWLVKNYILSKISTLKKVVHVFYHY